MSRSLPAPLCVKIEQQAMQLPGVSRDIKWGAVTVFSLVGKMFCCLSIEDGRLQRLSVKVPAERFLELTDQPGIIPAPYLARHHWVSLEPACTLNESDVLAMLVESYQLVRAKLPKKMQAALAPCDRQPTIA